MWSHGGWNMIQEVTENPFSRKNLIGEVIEGWQNMLNLAADLIAVPAGLITRINGKEIEVFLSSNTQGNPYTEGLKSQYPDSGFYCEWVATNRQPMLLPDARENPLWANNNAIKLNMVSYLGMPILRPDGEVFGTICFIDSKKNIHNEKIIKLVEQFKRMIEISLNALFTKEELEREERFVNDLARIFPICSYCKKVRDDDREWVSVEHYIKGISGKRASHGICPDCYEREIQNDELTTR
jgi:GAF domain-containing protein